MPDGPTLTPLLRRQTLAIGLALFAWPALAQAPRESRGAPAGEFDFYVLALSWSPGFCALEGERRGLDQCEPGRAFGFVIHGLWPQFNRGYPTECGPSGRFPGRQALDEATALFPSRNLAEYQWRKHGTCSGRSAPDYFRDARRARDNVRLPEALTRAAKDIELSPLDIERAFVEVNPGLRSDMIALACRRGVLQEVRICFDRTLKGFRTCPEVDKSGCSGGDLIVRAPR